MIAVPNVNCVWEKCKVKNSLLNKHLIHGFKTLRRIFVRDTSTRDNPILMNEKPAKTQATYVSHFIYTYSYYRRRYITVSVSNTIQRACGFACVFTLFRSLFMYIFIALHSMRSLSGALFGHLSRATRFLCIHSKTLAVYYRHKLCHVCICPWMCSATRHIHCRTR